MKKKLLLAGAVALMAAAAVTRFSAYNKTNVSDLLSANVEALARGEGGDHCTGPKRNKVCKCFVGYETCKDLYGCN